MNEFKFSALRQFGSENVSFTATIHSENTILSEEEIQGQVNQVGILINKAFIACQEREISEKEILMQAADKRREAVAKLDKALAEEVEGRRQAEVTMGNASKLDKALKMIEKEEKKGAK